MPSEFTNSHGWFIPPVWVLGHESKDQPCGVLKIIIIPRIWPRRHMVSDLTRDPTKWSTGMLRGIPLNNKTTRNQWPNTTKGGHLGGQISVNCSPKGGGCVYLGGAVCWEGQGVTLQMIILQLWGIQGKTVSPECV